MNMDTYIEAAQMALPPGTRLMEFAGQTWAVSSNHVPMLVTPQGLVPINADNLSKYGR